VCTLQIEVPVITGKLFAEAVDSLVGNISELAQDDSAMSSEEDPPVTARSSCLHGTTYAIWLEGVPDNVQTRIEVSPGPEIIFEGVTHRLCLIKTATWQGLMPIIPRVLYAIIAYS
jgi:hypothetical protein